MSSIEHKIELLEDLFNNIVKTKNNFKKSPKSRITKGYIEVRLQCLEDYWNSYRNEYKSLMESTKKEERKLMAYFREDLYTACEDTYLDTKADMTDTLLLLNTEKCVIRNGGETSSAEVKLPRMNLPTFSGAYEDWKSFEDTFTSIIHCNKNLSDVQKMHYLRSCLEGEAKNSIKHIQTTASNYSKAWETLRNRYNHKRLIVNAILKRLFSYKKVNTQSSGQLKILIDSTNECLHSLESMIISTSTWDPMIIYLIVQKLDSDTHKEWESYVSQNHETELPALQNLITFLENKIHTLELTNQPSSNYQRLPKERSFHASTIQMICKLCSGQHILCHCKEFTKFDPEKRSEIVREHRLCYNCLSPGHSVYYCKRKTCCNICRKRHHSLLHNGKKILEDKKEESQEVENVITAIASMHVNEIIQQKLQDEPIVSSFAYQRKNALLATALVLVRNKNGQETTLRALIDPGSQASFISEHATQLLRLTKTPVRGSITGVGATTTSVRCVVQLEILSRLEKTFSLPVKAYVLKSHITSKLPNSKIQTRSNWSHLDGLTLADPQYFVSSKIDLLLGIEVYTEIVINNLVKGPPGTPTAQETSLGWILFGNIGEPTQLVNDLVVMHHHVDIDMDILLKNLWSIDDTVKRKLTPDERTCEEIYNKEYSRTLKGKFIVKLPFKQSPKEIGSTREISLRRLEQMERKLENKPELKEEYCKIMEEYIELNHMEKVPEEEKKNQSIYLPHHAVVRDSETTKVRIVFDASCKSSNGVSLNDLLLVGPQLQEDLRNLIIRWRMKKICFIADIQKMYRMVLIAKEDVDYQRILWRKHPSHEVEDYRMLRVTFGTASAPYLAIKTLKQLAQDDGNKYPIGAKILSEDFYVDDCISGHNTVEEAIEASRELRKLLEAGGFILQKWASNNKDFLNQIPQSLRSKSTENGITKESIIKALGLGWNMVTDTFHYQIKLSSKPSVITKRSILGDIQRLFDPLGWISPAIIPAKILIQTIWKEKLDWDEYVGNKLEEEWIKIKNNFTEINKIQIQRWIHTEKEIDKIQLHGFCDASMKGYCAVVYYRVKMSTEGIKTGIIASKTKVAPLKTISLPRLELCGALLLAKLLTLIREAMKLSDSQMFAWTDSTVVLSWLNGDSNKWKPFVSNRVIEILDNTSNTQWYHVKSKDNPADLGSRGTYLKSLIKNQLWWEGPTWLRNEEINLIKPSVAATEIEMRNITVNTSIETVAKINVDEFDTLQELLRTIVYSLRFLRIKKKPEEVDKPISTLEYEEALLRCIKIAQQEEFSKDIDNILKKKTINKDSKLRTLNPYIDENNILRVGGRLRNADINNETKFPIILSPKHPLSNLIVKDAHRNTLHGGVQLMLSYIKTKYWIIRVKNIVKACIHKCIICARYKARTRIQLMGDLPKARITPARPFIHSGVDFAGPLQILMSRGRGAKSQKAYIAIFVCMATKAIHLELVSDLTSEAFIGAFRRFTSRRGRCLQLWSDHGRNFIGANKELQELFKEANVNLPEHLMDILAADGTQWHFIPTYSPNFGGLWEAGVKSTKFHLKRILNTHLTFEEMSTTLCQIEACLNSRPLIPIDTADTEFEVLTPGHFLIGEAPVMAPNPDLCDINIGHLSRWQLCQRLVSNFWQRWQKEYLTRLQNRWKWTRTREDHEIGDIVLLKEDQVPPGKWALGRILEKHPGQDGLTRVYTIKCRNGIVRRSISRICALPIDKK